MNFGKPPGEVATNATVEQILAAAETCFQEAGAGRTTVEDIASAAGVSRQTVYKYFPKKSDIINRICHIKVVEINAELRVRLKGERSFAKKITEAIALSVEVARENSYMRKLIADLDLLPNYDDEGQVTYQWQRGQWDHLITSAARSGELAEDLDTDRVVPWLILSQLTVQLAQDRMALRPEDARTFIRRFIVEPLLRRQGDQDSDAHRLMREDAMRSEIRDLRDLVSEQALELRALKRAQDI